MAQAGARKAASSARYWAGSWLPAYSRMACMASWAMPTSTVVIPRRGAVGGRRVEPPGRWAPLGRGRGGGAGLRGGQGHQGGAGGVGGVADVGVGLEHRPAVEGDLVLGVVAVGV